MRAFCDRRSSLGFLLSCALLLQKTILVSSDDVGVSERRVDCGSSNLKAFPVAVFLGLPGALFPRWNRNIYGRCIECCEQQFL
jgi:hypothetical protein